jgi:hypothetical protein
MTNGTTQRGHELIKNVETRRNRGRFGAESGQCWRQALPSGLCQLQTLRWRLTAARLLGGDSEAAMPNSALDC